jgi:DNA polymerase-1
MSEISKKRYFSILENIKEEHQTDSVSEEKILIIDGLNAFIRSYAANPTLNSDGEHIGGIAGFLKTIGYAIKLVRPTRCIVVFDGRGGSQKRRKIYPAYKENRKTKVRLNRVYEDNSTQTSEEEALQRQLMKVVQYLKTLPATVLAIDNIEADDTIAYISRQIFSDKKITIMSTDKDFLQLVDERINVWSPTKKKLYTPELIVEEYGISSTNFINYRILDGDKSDNINGVKGAGLKTILKVYPQLSENKQCTVEEIIKHAGYNISQYKVCKTIFENKEILERNYKLMQLAEVDISGITKLKIMEIVKGKINQVNKFQFLQLVTSDKMHDSLPNCNVWLLECFGYLDINAKKLNYSLEQNKLL